MIYDDNEILNDTLRVGTNGSAAQVVVPFMADCYSGHELSLESPVSDATVEWRQGDSGAWLTTPIDLTPYAGTREAFQFRLTSGTLTANVVHGFRFRSGPPIVAEYGQLTLNGTLITLNREAVTFTPDLLYLNGELITFNGEAIKFNP